MTPCPQVGGSQNCCACSALSGSFQVPCCVELCLSSPAGGFAKSASSCALGNCRRKTDPAAFFTAAFLWGTNTLAGVEFQSVIPNTVSSLETSIFCEALVSQLSGRSMHLSRAVIRSLSWCRKEELLSESAGRSDRPELRKAPAHLGGRRAFGGFWAGDNVESAPRASRVFLELSC